jgi:conjugal transfer ATP-binding protein TraC
MFSFISNSGKEAPLSNANPAYLYQDNKLILKDGRVAVGFRMHSAEMERWEPEAYTQGQTAFVQALKTMPVGGLYQKTDVYFDRPYVHPLTNNYFDNRMGAHFNGRPVLYHEAYVFLSFPPVVSKNKDGKTKNQKPPRSVSALNALINKADELLPQNPFSSVVASLALAEKHSLQFTDALRGVPDVSLERLDENQMRQLYLQFFNMEFDRNPQLLEREMLNEVGTLAVGERKVSCVTLTGQGSDVFPCVRNAQEVVSPMVYPLTQFLGVPHIYTQSFLVQDTKEELAALDRDKKLNNSLNMFATADNHIRVKQIVQLTDEVRSENKELCKFHNSILLWETDDAVRKRNVSQASTLLQSLYGAEAVIESKLTLPLFFSALPGNGFQVPSERWIPATTDRAACFTHFSTTYRSTPTGEYICDRSRNLIKFDLFDQNQLNQNSITIGPSGSGKSFTMAHLIVQRFEHKARQIIIDVGLGPGQGSYRNLVQSLTGPDFDNCYFEYDPEKPIQFNPFYIPRDPETHQWLYDGEKLTFHLSLIATIWKHVALTKPETAILAQFLKKYYAQLNSLDKLGEYDEAFPGMQGFYDFVFAFDQRMTVDAEPDAEEDPTFKARKVQYAKDMKYFDVDEFLVVLREYTAGGRYEKVLNARRDVDLSDYPLIAFDMARIRTDATLYPVVAMLITELSLDLCRKFPKDAKYILMDEAWSMLAGALESFIVSMYRTMRKTKGSMGIITQSIDDIIKSPIGQVLITNSATKIILRHEIGFDDLQNGLGFTSHEMSLIRSLEKEDHFREFVVKQGTVLKVFCLEAAPQLNAIISSKADHRNLINRLIDHYKQVKPVPDLDARGQVILLPDGSPRYTTVTQMRLDYAVDEFVELTSNKS